jgi:hypothetical protein
MRSARPGPTPARRGFRDYAAHLEAVRPGSVTLEDATDAEIRSFAADVGRIRLQLARRSRDLPCVYGPDLPDDLRDLPPGLLVPIRQSREHRPAARALSRASSRSGDSGDEPEPGEQAGRPLLLIADIRWGKVNRPLSRFLSSLKVPR